MADGPITRWDREAPTIFADAVLGSARAGGVHRITFGALIFNHEPDASIPAWNPAVTLALLYFAYPHPKEPHPKERAAEATL